MGILYDTQPDREPVELTHFDCWEDETEAGVELDFEARCDEVIKAWEKTFETHLHPHTLYRGDNIGINLYKVIGVRGVLDLVILRVLELGFDVYAGDEFIEIY